MMKIKSPTITHFRPNKGVQGFTLVELLIAMIIAAIVLAALYGSYLMQQSHYLAQSQVTEMQQNLRAAMDLISQDIRTAGYDPDGTADANFVDIEDDLISFTSDLNGDGDTDDTGEHIAYDLYSNSGVSTLGRTSKSSAITVTDKGGGHFEASNHQPVAQVIEALKFVYYDSSGNITAIPQQVQKVVVSILARADQEDPHFTNGASYPIGGPWPKNDNYRRRYQQITVECRNQGVVPAYKK